MKAVLTLFFALTGLGIVACAPHNTSPKKQSTTFSDDAFAAPEDTQSTEPFFNGQRDYTQLSPIEVPAVVRQRQAAAPTVTDPLDCSGSAPFRIQNPKLVINVDQQVMTFVFQAQTKKRGTEIIRLKGDFKRDSAPWRADLYAEDSRLLEERRVHATALCITAHVCDTLAVNIYYEVDGQPYCRQLQSGVQGPRIAMSGDDEETTPSKTIPLRDTDKENNEKDVMSEEEEVENDEEPEAGTVNPAAPAETPSLNVPPAAIPPTPVPPSAQPSPPPAAVKKAKKVYVEPRIERMPPKILDKQAIEYPGVMRIAPPSSENPYNIAGLVKTKPSQVQGETLVQAIGNHNAGRLIKADYLPLAGLGFIREVTNPERINADNDPTSAWGTRRMMEFVNLLGQEVEKTMKGLQITILSVSRKFGGIRPGTCTYYKNRQGKIVCSSSHQTGLDIDIRYLRKENRQGRFSALEGKKLSAEFDLEKNWNLAKAVHRTAQGRSDWLIVMFMDKVIKKSFCKHAKDSGEPLDDPKSEAFQTLRSITHWSGHTRHLHVRLYCPGTDGCGDTKVELPTGNGCP